MLEQQEKDCLVFLLEKRVIKNLEVFANGFNEWTEIEE